MLHPFSSGTRLPEYNDPRLRGLTLRLELSPQPVKLSEVRLLDVKVTLTNLAKHPIELQFPNEQRIEIYLLSSTERVLTKWSDNHAFADKPATILINPEEHIEYNEKNRDARPHTEHRLYCRCFFPAISRLAYPAEIFDSAIKM